MIANNKLIIYHKTTKNYEMTVTKYEGGAYNLSGFKYHFIGKKNGENPVIDLEGECAVDPGSGIYAFILTSALTDVAIDDYEWYAFVDNTDSPPIVKMTGQGILQIKHSGN